MVEAAMTVFQAENLLKPGRILARSINGNFTKHSAYG
jgi:hypothetical protein